MSNNNNRKKSKEKQIIFCTMDIGSSTLYHVYSFKEEELEMSTHTYTHFFFLEIVATLVRHSLLLLLPKFTRVVAA